MQLLFSHKNYYKTNLLLVVHGLFYLILFLFDWSAFIPNDKLGKAS